MTRRIVRGTLLVVVAVLAVSGCASDKKSNSGDDPGGSYDVDTPALRQQKADAGIEACPSSDPDASEVDGGLPDETLPCLGGGESVNLAGLARTPTVINVWQQTCGPCRTESPILQAAHEKAGTKLQILGLDFQDPQPGGAIAFADEFGLTYPQLADPDGVTRGSMRIQGFPMSFFVAADGTVTHVEPGAISSLDEFNRLVDEYLDVDLAAAS